MTTPKPPQAPPGPGRKPGRPAGSGNSRQTVLEAARARFASDGFSATTLRLVAADARVDVSLVMQFFRSKDALFAASLDIPESALDQLSEVFKRRDAQTGVRMVRAFFQAWDGPPAASEPLMAMLRNAMANEQARHHLRDYIAFRLAAGSEAWEPQVRIRAGLALSMLVGVVTGRQIIGVPALAELSQEALVTLLAPSIQQLLLPAGAVSTTGDPPL